MFHTTLPAPERKPGGVEIVVHRLANALVRYNQISVTVFSCSASPANALYDHVQLFPERHFASRLGRLTILPCALNLVDFSTFDVLHLHGDDWFFLWRSLPTVRTLHGSALREAQFAATLKRKLAQYAVYPLEHLSRKLATRCLAVGRDALRLYCAHGIVDNGVDLDIFEPRTKADYPLLCYVGTWQGRKRGAFAYSAFVRDVLPRFPDAKLYMACDFVPCHPSVIHGDLPDDATLAAWLARAWVFIYPSLYEAFGVPYVEALASGTAVVASPNEGANYILEDGRYGQLCNDAEFGPAIASLLDNAERRAHMAADGLTRARHFAWERIARVHYETYASLLRA